ncbi:tRNA1(Val) (adenine(37)-N6)-methyltransferase [Methylobrevis albus]|uniref:Methyltransferase n=1 Tax=Methylobrevis albus TaxID=2793297 RepID=A0A931I0K4_9HYPH|nr:methyltransferase [Methylobrevis albus]MBH0238127.1 methyltransferase [Methylobrevis albus]
MTDPTTIDGFLGGRLQLAQPADRGHRAGLDAVMLAAALPEGSRGRVADLGAGVGAVGFCVAARLGDVTVTFAERAPATLELLARNIAANAPALGDRFSIAAVDIEAPAAVREAAGLTPAAFDHVLMNPPFHAAGRGRASPDPARAEAHVAGPETLERWVRVAAGLLGARGTLTMIWRADGLGDVLAALDRRFGGIDVLPLFPHAFEPAGRVILRGRIGSRAPLALLPGFVLHEPDGGFTPAAAAVLAGAPLPALWRC